MTRWDGSGAQHLSARGCRSTGCTTRRSSVTASGERRAELVELLGRIARELSQLARRARAVGRRGGPTVYVLPGPRFADRDSRAPARRRPLARHRRGGGGAPHPPGAAARRPRPLGMMWLNTFKLKLSLTVAGFDARAHAYDWRLGIEALAAQLNARIAADARRDVMLVGHSMGGLVARAALAGNGRRIRRIVQIGAPNGSSYAPVLAMRGVYPTVRSSPLSISGTAPRTLRASSSARCRRCTSYATAGRRTHLFDAAQWPADALRPDASCSRPPSRHARAGPAATRAACT